MTDEHVLYDPCPECGGTDFREQVIRYETVVADESGQIEHIHSGDHMEIVAVWCENEDCPHNEEPLRDNWRLVNPESLRLNEAMNELVNVAAILEDMNELELAQYVTDSVDDIDAVVGGIR